MSTTVQPAFDWQYPGEWIEELSEGFISYVQLYLLEHRVGSVLRLACSHRGQGEDLRVHVYAASGGEELLPDYVDLCHRGGGLFHLYGSDQDVVEKVHKVLKTMKLSLA